MADLGHGDPVNQGQKASFVQGALGPWSSHPDMLARQRKIFRLVGYLPIVLGVLVAVLVLTSYKLSDFANVHDIATLCGAVGKLLGRCGWALIVLLCALCTTWGFSVTSNMLWGASRKISLTPAKKTYDRDAMPVPLSVLVVGVFFWLVPIALPIFKPMLTAIDIRLYWLLLVLANICCFLPFVLLRLWFSTGDDTRRDGRNGWRHPYKYLFAWVLFLALAVIVVSVPDFPPLTQFVDGVFATYVKRNFPWMLKLLDTTVAGLFRIFRFVIALYFAWKSLVYFLKWRLTWVPSQSQRNDRRADADRAAEGGDADTCDGDANSKTSESAKAFVENLPKGISSKGEFEYRSPEQSSPSDNGADPLGLRFLMVLPEGASPTKAQRNFFDRFVSSYEEARNGFLDNEDPRISPKQADLILHGEDGSGRTTILLASALYAAIVRGQRVLYFVSSRSDAERLADRVNGHLRQAMVDCYFSAGVLTPTDVDGWLNTYSLRPDDNGTVHLEGNVSLPPDILFATPEIVERCFFSSAMTLDGEMREAMRRMLVGFSLFVVDDFLDYPVAVRSHLAFIVDKFKLLLATEFVVPQFVVATSPLEARVSIDLLGQRLFGFNRFNRNQNVYEMHPRTVAPYLCATLVVKRGMSLLEAVRALLRDSLQKNLCTLLYYRGISATERAKLEEDFRNEVVENRLKVVGRLCELDEKCVYDHVFYVSCASGDVAGALRCNMAEEGTPAFFRVKMEGEDDSAEKETFVLLPDETAVSLRAFHLRSVLQYIPRLTPVEAGVWSSFGIYRDHPNVKDISGLDENGAHVDVQWYQDDLVGDGRYAEGQIWAYLVLVSNAAIGTRGRLIDFNVIPNMFESVWTDEIAMGPFGKRLLLVGDDKDDVSPQMVSWRDSKNVRIGETDLAHSEEMTYQRRGVEQTDDEEYIVGGVPPQEDIDADPRRFAMAVTARYRRGSEDDFLFPIRRFSWSIPTRDMEVVDLSRLNGLAQFKIRLKGDVSYRVNGLLKGLLNLKGRELEFYPHREFGYDAYMTCVVFDPTFRKLKAAARPEDYVRKCMSGTWATDMKEGFSPALTHALTVALRRRFPGWAFFAVAPVFYIEGREDSVGKAVMWLVEPANSGRTVEPVLRALFDDDTFWAEVIGHAHAVLEECGNQLWQLRMRSRLAFIDEAENEDDLAKALSILESVGNRREVDEATGDEAEDEGTGEEDEDDRSAEDVDDEANKDIPRKESLDFSKEEKEFERVVLKGLDGFQNTIDVTNTAFVSANSTNPKAVIDLFDDILWNHPEIFYVSKCARFQYWTSSNGQITRFVIRDIQYGITKAQYAEAKAQLDASVKEAMGEITGAMGNVEKAKTLHDYIIRVCDYDDDAAMSGDRSPLARTAYSVLVRHSAVCEGYTMAYRYLLDKVGIRSEEVVSQAMKHCWNYVFLRGHWYHVDVTWDDLGKGDRGADDAIHKYFLLSDGAIQSRKHHDWSVRGLPPATDTWYDNYNWGDSRSVRDEKGDAGEVTQGDPRAVYPAHVAFKNMNCGCNLCCRGKIVLRVYLVDDAASSWDESAADSFMKSVDSVAERLVSEASSDGVYVEMSAVSYRRKISQEAVPNDQENGWVKEVFGSDYPSEIVADQKRFRKALGCDESPIVFAFNKDFRSCALTATNRGTSEASRAGQEWSMVAFLDGDFENTLVHELLHLFGAVDLYYPENLKQVGKKYLPGSIMCDGNVIDDLTRYLIGWKRQLQSDSMAWKFLEETKNITAEDVRKANEAEWKKKWKS